MLNRACLIGSLVKDPTAKALPKGMSISQFTLATNHTLIDSKSKEKRESVEFHLAVCWGKLANVANKYLSKGSKVYLEGRLQSRAWQDASGDKHYRTEIIVSYLEMLGGGKRKVSKAEELPVIEIEEVPVEDAE